MAKDLEAAVSMSNIELNDDIKNFLSLDENDLDDVINGEKENTYSIYEDITNFLSMINLMGYNINIRQMYIMLLVIEKGYRMRVNVWNYINFPELLYHMYESVKKEYM